jgi:DNA-binding PadR family transcriptional regulator
MPVVNKTRYALLGILDTGAYSGYDIKKGIERSIGHFWHESYGQIYPILRALVGDGLATAHTEALPGRPARILYTITEQGRAELRRWLSERIDTLPIERNEFLLKLFFGAEVPLTVTLDHLRQHRRQAVGVLETFGEIEAMLAAQTTAVQASGFPFWLATLRYGQAQAEAVVLWCDETLERFGRTSQQNEMDEV